MWKAFLPSCENCSQSCFSLLCPPCQEQLVFKNACPACGHFPLNGQLPLCMPCQKKRFPWKNIYISFFYKDGIKKWLHDIKDRFRFERLRELKLPHLPDFKENYEAIIPAVSDIRNKQKRLFDVGEQLACRLGRLWNIPVFTSLFERKAFLASQRELGAEERKRYLKRIIQLKNSMKMQFHRVLLVDDVMTTGATAIVHAELLHSFTKTVDVYCLARAIK